MSHFTTYQTEFASVPGWFNPASQAIWDCLLSYQSDTDIHGNLLEIGVWKGKSALLSALYTRPREKLLLVDPHFPAEVRRRFGQLHNRDCVLLQCRSEALNSIEFLVKRTNRFRWIHIDGEHSGMAIQNDLKLADQLLNRQGILCLDDFLAPAYPQITQSTFRYLDAHPGSFALVLCGFNKGYFCRPIHAPELRAFIANQLTAELAKRTDDLFTLWRTTVPDDLAAYGITRRIQEKAYRGPDWAQEQRFD